MALEVYGIASREIKHDNVPVFASCTSDKGQECCRERLEVRMDIKLFLGISYKYFSKKWTPNHTEGEKEEQEEKAKWA